MAKNVKCIDCAECIGWALPVRVNADNLYYAKRCLWLVKNTVVCDRTHKTKQKDHEQYCKHYHEKIHRFDQSAEIEELETKIKEFEALAEMVCE